MAVINKYDWNIKTNSFIICILSITIFEGKEGTGNMIFLKIKMFLLYLILPENSYLFNKYFKGNKKKYLPDLLKIFFWMTLLLITIKIIVLI
jgi:hypothetical protein